MATKKKKRTEHQKARKRKKGLKFFFLSLIAVIGVASLAFLFFTISDFMESPVSEKATPAKKKERLGVTLYFSNANERFLMPEKRLLPKLSRPDLQAAEIVKAPDRGTKNGPD